MSVPIIITWKNEGNEVSVIGEFNDHEPVPLLSSAFNQSEKMCTIEVSLGSTVYYRYIVDGIEKFDTEQPFKKRGTQMYNYLIAPNEDIATDLLNMDINKLDEYEKDLYKNEFDRISKDPSYFDDIDEGEGSVISIHKIVALKDNKQIQNFPKPIQVAPIQAPKHQKEKEYSIVHIQPLQLESTIEFANNKKNLRMNSCTSDLHICVKNLKQALHNNNFYNLPHLMEQPRVVCKLLTDINSVQKRDIIELSNQIAVYLKVIEEKTLEINNLKISISKLDGSPQYNRSIRVSMANTLASTTDMSTEQLTQQISKMHKQIAINKRKLQKHLSSFVQTYKAIIEVGCFIRIEK